MKTPKLNSNKDNLDILNFSRMRRDLVLVKAIRPQSGKLVDPAQYEDKPEFGEVIKLSDEIKDLKVGDVVRFGKYSTELIRNQGNDYFLVRDEDISMVL